MASPDPAPNDRIGAVSEERFQGGCLCGGLRYAAQARPLDAGYCHCRMCQQAYGALYGLFATFPAEAFRYTQVEPTYYQSSSWAKRGFCGSCGSPVEFCYIGIPRVGVLIGTLDHPKDWPPNLRHSGIESKVPWHVITDDLPQIRSDEIESAIAAKARLRDQADKGE